jgi:hypothetical protein
MGNLVHNAMEITANRWQYELSQKNIDSIFPQGAPIALTEDLLNFQFQGNVVIKSAEINRSIDVLRGQLNISMVGARRAVPLPQGCGV